MLKARKAATEDLPSILSLIQDSAWTHFKEYGNVKEIQAWCDKLPGRLGPLVNSKSSMLLVVEEDQEIIATGYGDKRDK